MAQELLVEHRLKHERLVQRAPKQLRRHLQAHEPLLKHEHLVQLGRELPPRHLHRHLQGQAPLREPLLRQEHQAPLAPKPPLRPPL